MTDEALSALLDGECPPAELDRLLDSMERDPALKARYSRMCLVRDSLRGGRAKAVEAAFASRVLAALDKEAASTVVPFRPRRVAAPDQVRGRFWRPLAGLAAAAALAAVAVFFWPAFSLAPAPQQVAAEKTDLHWTELDAENARQLNRYLATYRQSRAEQGVGGTLSHARYAAYTADPAEPAPQERDR
jgi:negative regulator of sigma E activity